MTIPIVGEIAVGEVPVVAAAAVVAGLGEVVAMEVMGVAVVRAEKHQFQLCRASPAQIALQRQSVRRILTHCMAPPVTAYPIS